MTELSPALLGLLDRLTDPTHVAIADLREAVAELAGDICELKTAVDSDGMAAKDWLRYLVGDVEEAAERLARLLEARWPV